MKALLAVLLLAAGARTAAAAPRSPRAARSASKRAARKAPAKKAAPVKKAAPAAVSAPAPSAAGQSQAADSLDEIALFGLGADLEAGDGGLVVVSVRPGSRAEAAGLKAEDRLLRVDGPASSRAAVAARLRAWTPGTRLALIVRRGLEVRTLETAVIPPARDYGRGERDLSDHEKALAAERSAQGLSDGRAVVKAVAPLAVSVRADQGLWVRFPKGLPAGLKKGDEISAEAATGLTVDATLDYLAVAPGTRLRGRVLDSTDDGQVRAVRLAFYALELAGGGVYPTLGMAVAVSGDQRTARVLPGGTLVTASPLPDAKRRAPEPVLDADARLRVRLLEPLVVDEPPSYWRAGPGLWIKTVENGGRRLFEVTHAIAGRSGESAGLKVGERLESIGGRSTDKMDFPEAVDRLYGPPGSDVEVVVARRRSETLKLKRGRRWSGGKSEAIALAYGAQ